MCWLSEELEAKTRDHQRLVGYSLLAVGLAIVLVGVILALGFLTGYIAAPVPYPPEILSEVEEAGFLAMGNLANAFLTFGLLLAMIWGGGEIAGKGAELIKA
jgi:hypothetical protein